MKEGEETPQRLGLRLRSALPLLLVIAVLLGSVLVPARQSLRIMRLLRETTEIIEPARMNSARLEFGLTVEASALDDVMMLDDTLHRRRYGAAADDNDRRLASVEGLARGLDADALEHISLIRRRVDEWRAASRAVLANAATTRRATEMPNLRSGYELALQEVTRFASYLAAEGSVRRERIQGSEWLGLLVNASLVFVAIAAVLAVGALRRRERRLTVVLQRRIDDEAVLREGEKRALDAARQGKQELERVMSSRSRLMRGFSHDVKNPLNAADGYAELLTIGIYGELSGEQRESVQRIRRCIHGAIGLIEDLHEMARAETGHIQLHIGAVDLAELARSIGQDYMAAAEAAGLAISVELPRTALMVDTDATRVRQIVSNLLSNAIKYTASGQVVLRVRRNPATDPAIPDGTATIEVCDTGCGIPAEKHGAIFEEFVRLGANEKSGAGLGLAVSQRLAQALGGQITLTSAPSRGSTFSLCLPCKPGGQRVSAPAAPRSEGVSC